MTAPTTRGIPDEVERAIRNYESACLCDSGTTDAYIALRASISTAIDAAVREERERCVGHLDVAVEARRRVSGGAKYEAVTNYIAHLAKIIRGAP